MTGLNAQYVLAPSLQEYFVDKTTGLSLVAGKVYFYKDNSRSSLKEVFQLIDGGGENYSYVALPNPIILSSVGTIQDNSGNDILPYYYPYNSSGNVELYYVVVKDSDGTEQLVRPAWPNLITTTQTTDNLQNFLPNGQFNLHSTIFSSTATTVGAIDADTTIIAPGGWLYDRSTGATDSDFITFPRFNNYTNDPDKSPRYAVNVSCTLSTNATYKYLVMRFNDVNKFSSDTQQYSVAFFGKSSSSDTIQILTRKYFGTGGSPSSSVTTNVGTINLNSNYPSTAYVTSFTFGANTSYSIGTNDDDYVDLIISFPINDSFNCTFTDFALVLNQQSTVSFPITTDNEFSYQSQLAFLANSHTNADYYLPIIRTASGLSYDTACVGRVYARLEAGPITGELLCDGTTYIYSKYSTDLIPYSRLGDKLFINNVYLTGGGVNYVSATAEINTGVTNLLFICANQAGTSGFTQAPVDGTTTGLSYLTTFSAISSGYSIAGQYGDSAIINLRGTVVGSVTAPNAHTSGFTVTDLDNSSVLHHTFTVLPTSSAGLGGKYWTFSTTTTNFYVWYQVNGVGADPAPGGTGIKVNLSTNDAIDEVNIKTIGALVGGYGITITCPAAASINAGSYFTFGVVLFKFYVWFVKNGVGSDPLLASPYIGIKVTLSGSETAAQVNSAITIAINKAAYAAPDYRGLFLRGRDSTNIWDYNSSRSLPYGYGTYRFSPNQLGTIELDVNHQHNHTAATTTATTTTTSITKSVAGSLGTTTTTGAGVNFTPHVEGVAANSSASGLTDPTYTASSSSSSSSTTTNTVSGNSESAPVNSSVNWFIKY